MAAATKNSSEYSIVLITCPNTEVGEKLASGLVESKLAACVNILPAIQSVYRWEGKIHKEPETLLIVKTRTRLFDQLCQFVKENHPYSVPEVIALPIETGLDSYLDWIGAQTPSVRDFSPGEASQ